MDDLFAILCALSFVLAVVTVVGHGIWVLAAKIFSAGGPPQPRPLAGERASCPRCFSPLPGDRRPCAVCNWPAAEVAPSQSNALKGLAWQVKRLARLGVLDTQTQKRILHTISAEDVPPAVAATTDAPAITPPSPARSAEPPREPPEPAEPRIPADVGSRAEQYASRRAAAAAETPREPAPQAPRRREAVSKLLAAFMEEKNIRWGELVGGLLIICSSIALVISFWSDIAASTFVKFFLFGGVTAALFGIGLYTERRWKLRTTSQGVLIIATLLVPLNFLAIAAFTQDSPPTHPIAIGGEVLSLGLFAALVWVAGRIYLPGAAILLSVAVMVPSVMQLLTRRFVEPTSPLELLYAAAILPVATYLATTAVHLRSLFRLPTPERRDADGLFILFGVATFAALLPLALVLYKTQTPGQTVHRLAPLVTLLGLPAIAAGLWFWRRVTDRELVGERTAGISIGVVGAATILAAVVFAWPEPAILLPVAILTAAAFTAIALVFGIFAAHGVAGAAMALAWLVAFFLIRGDVSWNLTAAGPLVDVLLSAASGTALAPLAAVFVLVAFAWTRVRRAEDAWWYLVLARAASVASLALVTWFGFGRGGDPHGATWVYAGYAVAAIAVALVRDRLWLGWTASALILVTLVQAIVYRWTPPDLSYHVWCVALLSHASITTLLAGVRAYGRGRHAQLVRTMCHSALAGSVAALALLVLSVPDSRAAEVVPLAFWLCAIWLAVAWIEQSPGAFTAFQTALFISVFAAVAAAVEGRPWYLQSHAAWLHPWFLQLQGIAAAAVCLAWIGVRLALRPVLGLQAGTDGRADMATWRETAGLFLDPPWPARDRIVQAIVVVLLIGLAVYAAAPGVCQELAPRDRNAAGAAPRIVPPVERFAHPAVPHEPAAGIGTWTLLTVAAVMLTAGLWEGHLATRTAGLLFATAAICPLVATRWEASVAVASSLRWSTAAFFVVASLPLWWKDCVGRWAARLGIASCRRDIIEVAPNDAYRAALFTVAVVPYVAMVLYVGLASIARAGVHASVAPLLPWLAVVFVVAGLAALMLRQVAAGRQAGQWGEWAEPASSTVLVLGTAPLVVALLFAVAAAIRQHPILGPDPNSFFRNIGWSASYALPVLVMAAALVGHAIRERSSRIAFAAGLTFNLGATAGFLLLLPRLGRGLDGRAWVNVAQVNTVVAAAFALGWLAVLWWDRRRTATGDVPRPPARVPTLLLAQVSLAAGLCLFAVVPAVVWLAARPVPGAWVVEAGGWLGWLSTMLTVGAVAWLGRTSGRGLAAVSPWAIALGVSLVSLTAARWDTGNWLAYHTLLAASGAAMGGLVAFAYFVRGLDEQLAALVRAAVAFGLFAVVLSIRAVGADPQHPWWAIGGLAAVGVLAVGLAVASPRRWLLYAAAVLLNLAGSVWWLDRGYRLVALWRTLEEFLLVNVLLGCIPIVLWVVIEIRCIRPRIAAGLRPRLAGVHHVISWISVAAMLLIVAAGLSTGGGIINFNIPLAWAALGAAFVAACATLWDRVTQAALARIYFLTLAAAGLILNGLDLEGPQFWWMLTIVLAAFSLATSYVWSRRGELRSFAARVGIPVAEEPSDTVGLAWLVPANSVIAAGVTALAFWMILTLDSFTERMLAAYAVVAQAVAIGLLARGALRSPLQYASLLLGALFAVAFGWAWLPVNLSAPLLHRTVVLAVALAAMLVLYGLGLVKLLRRENEWTLAAQWLLPLLVVAETAAILVVLGTEVAYYARQDSVPTFWYEIVAVAIALATMCLAALAAAMLPGRDPLGLSERGRQAYVYAAEVVLALFCVHIRVTMPWLFHGWFVRYWPLVVMGIAFAGVGAGEWLARKRTPVLSEPLQTTGALLPLLPVLGFWFLPGEVNYSLLLLTVGVLYAALSALRQSFLYGVLAALAANGSLWYLLHDAEGLGIAQHPQLWLIPPALCVLVAAYLNRDQLTNEQMTTVRYMSAIVIYVASTADIFINGVADAPWLPLVLAAISIVGIFAGILLRVRAFVYLGTSFLLVALLTIIWYAAVELGYAWLWWVCGIIAGVCIIAVFAVFEKRRDDMLQLVDRLRAWEP